MIVLEYEVRFHALSRYFYDKICIEFEKILKFVNGLYVSLLLDTSQMVVFGASF